MPRTRPPYPPQFRREAIALVRSSGEPVSQIAKDLGCTEQTLRNWVKQAEVQLGERPGLSTEEGHELRELRRRVRILEQGRGFSQDLAFLLREGKRDAVSALRFIAAERANHRISLMCRVLGVSRSGFHAWERRPVCERSLSDGRLSEKIKWIHSRSRETYGAPRVHAELRHEGTRVSRKRVERLMRRERLSGLKPRKRGRTTIRVPGVRCAPDLVERDFSPAAKDRLWAADITYVRTWEGWLYVATVIDCFSRRVVGWAIEDHMRAELVVDALEMAVGSRRPGPGLVHHSDQGSQFVALVFSQRLRAAGPVDGLEGRLL